MAQKKPATKSTRKTTTKKTAAKKTTATRSKAKSFTADERAAMKDRAAELKAEARGASKAEGEKEVLSKIAQMPQPDRALAERLHAIVKDVAPDLTSRTWYGMPAYAKDGKVVCWFQNASKFKFRYSMIGFSDQANLDKGNVWPVAYAVTEFTADDEAKVRTLVKKAVS
jgi:uncharacterized protein YdhG (YjbR/CyaY superfamily)